MGKGDKGKAGVKSSMSIGRSSAALAPSLCNSPTISKAKQVLVAGQSAQQSLYEYENLNPVLGAC